MCLWYYKAFLLPFRQLRPGHTFARDCCDPWILMTTLWGVVRATVRETGCRTNFSQSQSYRERTKLGVPV